MKSRACPASWTSWLRCCGLQGAHSRWFLWTMGAGTEAARGSRIARGRIPACADPVREKRRAERSARGWASACEGSVIVTLDADGRTIRRAYPRCSRRSSTPTWSRRAHAAGRFVAAACLLTRGERGPASGHRRHDQRCRVFAQGVPEGSARGHPPFRGRTSIPPRPLQVSRRARRRGAGAAPSAAARCLEIRRGEPALPGIRDLFGVRWLKSRLLRHKIRRMTDEQ